MKAHGLLRSGKINTISQDEEFETTPEEVELPGIFDLLVNQDLSGDDLIRAEISMELGEGYFLQQINELVPQSQILKDAIVEYVEDNGVKFVFKKGYFSVACEALKLMLKKFEKIESFESYIGLPVADFVFPDQSITGGKIIYEAAFIGAGSSRKRRDFSIKALGFGGGGGRTQITSWNFSTIAKESVQGQVEAVIDVKVYEKKGEKIYIAHIKKLKDEIDPVFATDFDYFKLPSECRKHNRKRLGTSSKFTESVTRGISVSTNSKTSFSASLSEFSFLPSVDNLFINALRNCEIKLCWYSENLLAIELLFKAFAGNRFLAFSSPEGALKMRVVRASENGEAIE